MTATTMTAIIPVDMKIPASFVLRLRYAQPIMRRITPRIIKGLLTRRAAVLVDRVGGALPNPASFHCPVNPCYPVVETARKRKPHHQDRSQTSPHSRGIYCNPFGRL
jgi:hypothetical protein